MQTSHANNLGSLLAKRARRAVWRLLGLQILLVMLLTSGLYFANPHSAYSALIAGLICLLGNGVFIYRWFSQFSKFNPRQMLASFYRYEVAKLVMMVVLMVFALTKLQVSIFPFLGTYLLLQFSLVFAPIILTKTMFSKGVGYGA